MEFTKVGFRGDEVRANRSEAVNPMAQLLLILLAAAAVAVDAQPHSSPCSLQVGTMALRLPMEPASGLLGLELTDSGHTILAQTTPAQVALGQAHEAAEVVIRAGYTSATQLSATLLEANATLTHGTGGASFAVCDRWAAVGSGALARFELNRTLTVLRNAHRSSTIGVQSRLLFELASAPPGTTVGQLTAFAPALWYGNNSGIVSGGAIGANKTMTDYFIRADRFAAPLFSVLSPPGVTGGGVRGRATLFSLDRGFETVMADNASTLLVDARLGYGALGLHQPPPGGQEEQPQPVQLGYLYPGTEFSRTYTKGNQVLHRYHPATKGAVSRCSVAVTVHAMSPAPPGDPAGDGEDVEETADLWKLIKAAWPLQRVLYVREREGSV